MLRLGGTVATVALTPDTRARALEEMSDAHGLDILVIGGGVTGAGIALDAASRGLRTGIIEAQDWASGTSSRSSKLVHGGLRYLQMFDFTLVHEALTERDLLLAEIAPHLVRKVPFLYPLVHRVWERFYAGSGVALYDVLASLSKRRRSTPFHRHISKTKLRSEEHTSELQSRGHLVCRLLLEKKNRHGPAACTPAVTVETVEL